MDSNVSKASPMKPSNTPAQNSSTPSAMFRVIFFTILALTLSSGIYSVRLASQSNLTSYQVQVLEISSRICYGGSSTIFGLLGVKRLPKKKSKTDQIKPEE
jgi:hypothetical protein